MWAKQKSPRPAFLVSLSGRLALVELRANQDQGLATPGKVTVLGDQVLAAAVLEIAVDRALEAMGDRVLGAAAVRVSEAVADQASEAASGIAVGILIPAQAAVQAATDRVMDSHPAIVMASRAGVPTRPPEAPLAPALAAPTLAARLDSAIVR